MLAGLLIFFGTGDYIVGKGDKLVYLLDREVENVDNIFHLTIQLSSEGLLRKASSRAISSGLI